MRRPKGDPFTVSSRGALLGRLLLNSIVPCTLVPDLGYLPTTPQS
jgi:hypothetical protein